MVLVKDTLYEQLDCAVLQAFGSQTYLLSFKAMGTLCRILFQTESRSVASVFRKRTFQWLADFEAKYSRFIPQSLICEINNQAGQSEVATDDELESIFRLCDWYHRLTGGLFDPTALPLLKLWDYHAPSPVVPDPGLIQRTLPLVNWNRVQRQKGFVFLPVAGMALDLGGIGKEYAVDRVLEMGVEQGLDNIMVDFGHDLRVHGAAPEGGPWRIGLEDPLDQGRCWGGVAVNNRAVATSGDYLRHFVVDGKRYGHIIDPRTGYPVDNGCRAVSVIAPTCTEAGMVATTAFILGPERGLNFLEQCHQVEGCIWTDEFRIQSRRLDDYVIETVS